MSRAVSAKLPKPRSAIKSAATKRSSLVQFDGDREGLFECSALRPRPKTAYKKVELERIQAAKQAISKEEERKLFAQREAEFQKLELESKIRKRSLQELDAIRDEKLGRNYDPFADEKIEQDGKLLNRAQLAKHEQEDEVKRANKIILAAKVHALQDAQIHEKKELEKQWREKELRLERMMVELDEKRLAEQNRREQEMKEIRDRYANELKAGFKSRELKKLIEAERIENEAKAMAMAQQILKREEEAKERERLERRNQYIKNFQEAVNSSEVFKKRAEEQQRAAEMKAQEYMRQKAEEEKQLKKERKWQREQKQKEIDRILERQKELLQTKQDSETANLRRIQEQKEREFRNKIMEAAIKRKELQSQVLKTRAAQIEEMKRIKAQQEEMEAIERQRELEQRKKAEEKEKVEKEKMQKLKEKYRAEIIRQITQQVEKRQSWRNQSYHEYEEQQKREEARQENVRKVIAAKVTEMRESKIPEHIIRDVERQLKLDHN